MAEVTIYGLILDSSDEFHASPAVVFINDDKGYAFFIASTGQAAASITEDGGDTWGSPAGLTSQTDCFSIGVWYDRWTPDDTGTKIHYAFAETGTDGIYYMNSTAHYRSRYWYRRL